MKVILALLLISSVILNIMLARKVGRLNQSLSSAERLQSLTVGDDVPFFEAKELNGDAISIDYADSQKPTILYIFMPECMWCSRNLENIKALSESVAGDYRIVGISMTTEELPAYLDKYKFTFPVYTEPSIGAKTNYKLGVTPKTIVVSPESKVLKTWNRTYMGDLKSEIEDYFQSKLPGVQDSFNRKD